MNVEERLSRLEERLRAAEDELAIIRLLNSYGPLVDSGEGQAAAELWTDDGAYDVGGNHRLVGHEQLKAMYDSQGHQDLIHIGSSHFTGTPRVTVKGDTAEAVAYSLVVKKEDDRWFLWRAAINHWDLVRTPDGWRIKERYNRTLDGSDESHDTMRRILRNG